MKKSSLLSVFLLSIFLGFISCSDDKEGGGPVNTLTVTPEKIEFEAKGGKEIQLKVETSAPSYTYTVEGDWFEIKEYQDNKYLGVIAHENTSLEMLEGKITISAEHAIDKVISVLQSGADTATLYLADSVLLLAKDGVEGKTIRLETNQASVKIKNEGAETLPSWCSVELAADNKSLTVSVKENDEGQTRDVVFYVVAGIEGNQIEKKIEITQSAYNVLHLNATGYRLKLTGMNGIEATPQDEWCKVSVDGDILSVSAGDNIGGSTRKTEIELSDGSKLWVEQSAESFNSGDVFKYNDIPVGVVVSNDEDGILILALEEKEEVAWSTEDPVGLNSHQENAYEVVKQKENWKELYPAFAYCAEMDEKTGMEGWNLGEYFYEGYTNTNSPFGKLFANHEVVKNALDKIEGAAKFDIANTDKEYATCGYWTSSPNSEWEAYGWGVSGVFVHFIWSNMMKNVSSSKKYYDKYRVRCFWKFVDHLE